MKKMINTSFAYMIAGLGLGVFYREFTKFQGFTGTTTLSVLHTHALVLGMIMFLVVALFFTKFNLNEDPKFQKFYLFYNLGLITTLTMLFGRGLTQVLSIEMSKGLDASISGMSGLGHIIMTIGLMYLFTILKKAADSLDK